MILALARVVAFVLLTLAANAAFAQSCPPTPQARALESRGDPLGYYCMRVFQSQYARTKCNTARSALDMDECQYLAEMLIEGLQSCSRGRGGPYGSKCAAMMGEAQGMLARVNRNPVLLQHRSNQRGEQDYRNSCFANIGTQCAAQCAGNSLCMANCQSGNAWQCNR